MNIEYDKSNKIDSKKAINPKVGCERSNFSINDKLLTEILMSRKDFSSEEISLLEEIKMLAKDDIISREKKLAEIKAKIQNNEYLIDSSKIVEGIMKEAKEKYLSDKVSMAAKGSLKENNKASTIRKGDLFKE